MLHLLLPNITLKMLMPLLPKLVSNSMLPRQASELLNSATLKPLTLFMLPKLPSKHLTRPSPLPTLKELLQLISSKEIQLMSLTDVWTKLTLQLEEQSQLLVLFLMVPNFHLATFWLGEIAPLKTISILVTLSNIKEALSEDALVLLQSKEEGHDHLKFIFED